MPGKSFEEAKYVFTPPLRSKSNHAPLWEALADGSLSVVSTDHCPFRFEDQKSLGLQTTSPKSPTEAPASRTACSSSGITASTPACSPRSNLYPSSQHKSRPHLRYWQPKGVIAPGYDADILLWDPNADYTISAATQAMNTDYSMFEGWKVKGNAAKVFSRGKLHG